jgi:hypothetical protein
MAAVEPKIWISPMLSIGYVSPDLTMLGCCKKKYLPTAVHVKVALLTEPVGNVKQF